MRSRSEVLVFDETELLFRRGLDRLQRWACWAGGAKDAILVGNKGSVLLLEPDQRITSLESPTEQNLRCAEFSPMGKGATIVGNRGTVLDLDYDDLTVRALDLGSSSSDMRRIAWRPGKGDSAIVVGNDGAAYRLLGAPGRDRDLRPIEGAGNNLRSISWHPDGEYAMITGNCFRPSMAGLVPSTNLYRYTEGGTGLEPLQPLQDSRDDLVSCTWTPDGATCYCVGFDSVWHTPKVFAYDGEALCTQRLEWFGSNYPTVMSWHPSGRYALVGTGGLAPGDGTGKLLKFEGGELHEILDLGGLWVSCISWSARGQALVVASRIRIFSA